MDEWPRLCLGTAVLTARSLSPMVATPSAALYALAFGARRAHAQVIKETDSLALSVGVRATQEGRAGPPVDVVAVSLRTGCRRFGRGERVVTSDATVIRSHEPCC